MNLEAYLRHGITVVFCPCCQMVRELTKAATPERAAELLEWRDSLTCVACGAYLEVVEPPPGNTLALAK